MTEVLAQSLDEQRNHLDLADDRVAAPAQKATHAPGVMAVVNDQLAVGRIAEQTAASLGVAHLLDLSWCQPVLAHQPRSQVLCASGLGVGPSPLAQAFVAALPVPLPVLAVATADTRAALLSPESPFGELTVGEIARTYTAGGHAVIMPCDTIMHDLDQPCHADVLLELANGGVA